MSLRSVDQAEAAQADFVACFRVADLPAISAFPASIQAEVRENRRHSTRQPCEKCGETILVSAGNPAGIPRICTHCHEQVRQLATRAAKGRA